MKLSKQLQHIYIVRILMNILMIYYFDMFATLMCQTTLDWIKTIDLKLTDIDWVLK